jgi:hypothetical protein
MLVLACEDMLVDCASVLQLVLVHRCDFLVSYANAAMRPCKVVCVAWTVNAQ